MAHSHPHHDSFPGACTDLCKPYFHHSPTGQIQTLSAPDHLANAHRRAEDAEAALRVAHLNTDDRFLAELLLPLIGQLAMVTHTLKHYCALEDDLGRASAAKKGA